VYEDGFYSGDAANIIYCEEMSVHWFCSHSCLSWQYNDQLL